MNYNENNIIFILKILIILYMILIPILNTNFVVYNLNNNISKFLFILLVISITYYDTGLGLLLTLSYILSVNYKIIPTKYKHLSYKKEYKYDDNINLDNKNYYKYDYNY